MNFSWTNLKNNIILLRPTSFVKKTILYYLSLFLFIETSRCATDLRYVVSISRYTVQKALGKTMKTWWKKKKNSNAISLQTTYRQFRMHKAFERMRFFVVKVKHLRFKTKITWQFTVWITSVLALGIICFTIYGQCTVIYFQ